MMKLRQTILELLSSTTVLLLVLILLPFFLATALHFTIGMIGVSLAVAFISAAAVRIGIKTDWSCVTELNAVQE